MIDNPDPEDRLIFSIIILQQYNIAWNNIILQKRLLPARLEHKKGGLKSGKARFLGEKSEQYKE